MEFRDYAAKETSALVVKLLAARADSGRASLEALREALTRAIGAAGTALTAPPEIDGDLQELVRRLNHAATAAVKATAQRIQEEAAETLLGVQAELEAERTRADELTARLADTQKQAAALQADVQREAGRAAQLERDRQETAKRLDAQAKAAEAARRQEAEARATAEGQLREMRGLLDASLSEGAALTRRLEAQTAANGALSTELAETRAVRDELETALAATEAVARARDEALGKADDEVRALRQTLDDTIATAARLSVQLETATSDQAERAAELATARDAIARLESTCAAADVHGREQSEARAAAEHELQILRRSLEDAIADAARLTVRLEEAGREAAETTAQIDAIRSENDQLRMQRIDLEVERDSHAARVAALEEITTDQAARLTELEIRLEALARSEAALRDQARSRPQESAGPRADLDALRGELDQLAILFDSTLHAADEIARATTIAEALNAVVRQLAGVYPRVALFGVRGNHLEGQAQIGFDLGTDISKIVIPLNVDSPLALAASTQSMQTIQGGEPDEARHIPFGTTQSSAIALPVVVRGETLAVMYAEEPAGHDADAPAAVAAHGTFAGLMARHAAALIMRLTDELKAMTELTDYARLLLQEAAQMHAADLHAGRSEEDVRRRLKDSIDCAHQLYTQRAATDGPGAARLLDDQLTAAIETEPDSRFARDLAAVLGRSAARRAAEAS